MAAQPIGAHTAATSPDPAHILMQAVNSLATVKACLLANEPMYGFAQQHLQAAQQAVAALAAIETSAVVH